MSVSAFTGTTIIVVDDDDGVRGALEALLQSEGFTVLTFGSGGDFLDSDDTGGADCLLLDLNMPEMDGEAVLLSLAERGIDLPVIVITSVDDPTIKARVEAAGSCAILEKPIDHEKLFESIRDALKDSPPG